MVTRKERWGYRSPYGHGDGGGDSGLFAEISFYLSRAMMFIVAVRRTVGRSRTCASTVDFSRHVTSYDYYYVT
jgi:hypothetical protein